MKKKFLLFDVDRTLLDFSAAERKGLEKCFRQFQLPFSEELLNWYLKLNHILWTDYEKGLITRESIFDCRFEKTFRHFGLDADGREMERAYRQALSEGDDLMPHALEVVSHLAETHALYIVTNGLASTQERRLRSSGLAPYFQDFFVSEAIGYQKPMPEYFEYCFQRIPHFRKDAAIIIGDSLSSDIQGGVNAKIDTCWFNPQGAENTTALQPTCEIRSLTELLPLFDATACK